MRAEDQLQVIAVLQKAIDDTPVWSAGILMVLFQTLYVEKQKLMEMI